LSARPAKLTDILKHIDQTERIGDVLLSKTFLYAF